MSPDDFNGRMILNHSVIARVITQATMTEVMINAYIAEYYTRCPNGDYLNSYLSFIYDILDNKFLSLNTKIDILFKVFKRTNSKMLGKGDRKLFEDWLKIRNVFAHGKMLDDKMLYGGELLDIQVLADKSAKLQFRIHTTLERYSELRGQYFNQLPLKETKKSS